MLESALTVLLAWTLAAQQGLCGKLEKVAQQPNNVLVDYYAYRHISIVHFNVPELSVAIAFKYVSDPRKFERVTRDFAFLKCSRRESIARLYFNLNVSCAIINYFHYFSPTSGGSDLKNLDFNPNFSLLTYLFFY